jgi:bacterioferritin-associated ferredoxin
MKRFLAMLLLAFLPLHMSVAAVVPYCQHEGLQGSAHIGHHEHEHSAHVDDKAQAEVAKLAGIDTDCGTCHSACSSAVPSTSQQAVVSSSALEFSELSLSLDHRPLARPERPKWIARV